MNVTLFYLFIGAVLGAVFFFFKPLKVDIASPGELAQIELNDFTVHEVTEAGVKTILSGVHARRFADRYEVDTFHLMDRSQGHVEQMQAAEGSYREPLVSLRGDVRFERDDGIVFETQSADYNQSSGVVSTPGRFVLWQAADRVEGTKLYYNIKSGEITAKKIAGTYTLKERM